jgi:hypothetical protein
MQGLASGTFPPCEAIGYATPCVLAQHYNISDTTVRSPKATSSVVEFGAAFVPNDLEVCGGGWGVRLRTAPLCVWPQCLAVDARLAGQWCPGVLLLSSVLLMDALSVRVGEACRAITLPRPRPRPHPSFCSLCQPHHHHCHLVPRSSSKGT